MVPHTEMTTAGVRLRPKRLTMGYVSKVCEANITPTSRAAPRPVPGKQKATPTPVAMGSAKVSRPKTIPRL